MAVVPDLSVEAFLKPNGWLNQTRALMESEGLTQAQAKQRLCETTFELPGSEPPLRVSAPVLIALKAVEWKAPVENFSSVFHAFVTPPAEGMVPETINQHGNLPVLGTLWAVAWHLFHHERFEDARRRHANWPENLRNAAAEKGHSPASLARLMDEAIVTLTTLREHRVKADVVRDLGVGLCRAYIAWANWEELSENALAERGDLFMEAVRAGCVSAETFSGGEERQKQHLALIGLWQGHWSSSPDEQLGRFADTLACMKNHPISPSKLMPTTFLEQLMEKGAQLDPLDPLNAKRQAALKEQMPQMHARLRERRGGEVETVPDVRRRRRSPT